MSYYVANRSLGVDYFQLCYLRLAGLKTLDNERGIASMESPVQDILKQLQALRGDFEGLAVEFESAAKILRSPGLPPVPELTTELVRVRESHNDICSRVSAVALSVGVSRGEILRSSLDEIEGDLRRLEKEHHQSMMSAVRLLLEQILRLKHRDGRLNSEMQVVEDAARDFHARFVNAKDDPQILQDAAEMLALRHPLSALVRLAVQGATLDEDEQVPLAELVEQAFGKRVLLAAVQGHLGEEPVPLKSKEGGAQSAAQFDHKSPSTELVAPPTTLDVPPQPSDEQSCFESLPKEHNGAAPSRPASENETSSAASNVQEGSELPEFAVIAVGDVGCLRPPDDCRPSTPGVGSASVVDATEESISSDGQENVEEKRNNESGECLSDARQQALPEELASYQKFSEWYYLTSSDCIEPAWWLSKPAEFAAQANTLMETRLSSRQLGHVWLLCDALQQIGQKPQWSPQDVAAFAQLHAQPHSPIAGTDPQRLERLKRNVAVDGPADLRLPLMLESLRPSSALPLDYDTIDRLVNAAKFRHPELREFVRKSLKTHFHGHSVMSHLQQLEKKPLQRSEAGIRSELAQKRSRFREEMTQLWSAAGGTIRQTHCREVWQRFILKIESHAKRLYPPPHGAVSWNVVDTETWILAISGMHRKLADKGDVKHDDRRHADKAAAHIAKLATDINNLMRELQNSHQQQTAHLEIVLPTHEAILLTSPDFSGPTDILEIQFTNILKKIVSGNPSDSDELGIDGLSLSLADFVAYPELLAEMKQIDCGGHTPPPPCAQAREVHSSPRAASYLLERSHESATGGLDILVRSLRERRRFDLLGKVHRLLSDADRDAVRHATREQAQELNRLLADLHRRWRHLFDMAAPTASDLRMTYQEAVKLSQEQLNRFRSPLFLAWLRKLHEYGDREIELTRQRLRQRACRVADADRQLIVLRHIEQQQYTEALWCLGEPPANVDRWRRETIWRHKAEETFPDPLDVLRRHQGSLDYAEDLIIHWRKGYQGGNQTIDRPLRTKFAHLMFSPGQQEPSKPSGINDTSGFRVLTSTLVRWFANQNLNPCFLPQVRRFSDIIILTPIDRVESSSLVERLRSQVAGEQGKLCVVLAPRLAAQVRDELLAEFRSSNLFAAVIDDIDLCRLLNPEGRRINLVIGLLEIIFEQQQRQTFTPFERHDGQHVKLEMFVGRAEQAREIAQTSQYSRLFSGRKLGKSALLSYVEQKYDRYELPSGNRLRVLYVSGVSAGEESEFVARVVDVMRERLEFHLTAPSTIGGTSAADRMVAVFDQFTRERENESLLILFDEADLFVERQIDEYDSRREQCLSFVIRSQVESRRDSHGLPRIRFLFSGYRVTYTNAGAWAGAWGDVLRLEPLAPDEAATLVRGPLERLGMNASDTASLIAWRCGYQPSIIISFCRQLLQVVRENAVTSDDVAIAFDDPKIQDEIRTVIESNFQGNSLARIVFLCTILLFYERHPIEGVRDLPETLLARLRGIVDDLRWLHAADEKAALSRIASFVQDFVRRQLVRTETGPDGGVSYFPRFPHHLPVLAQALSRNAEGKISAEIEGYLRGREFERDNKSPMKSLFAPNVIERLREAVISPIDSELPLRAVVIASTWEKAISIPAILPKAVEISGDTPENLLFQALENPQTVVRDASGTLLSSVASQSARFKSPPLLIGGADLLRTALALDHENGECFEYGVLGRISRTAIEWWFHRFRALELESRGYDLIMEKTSGIPWLVGLFDDCLQQKCADGANLSEKDILAMLPRFDELVSRAIPEFVSPGSRVGLTKREIEILRMVVTASQDARGQPLAESLTSLWDDFYRPQCQVERLSPADHVGMSVLQQLGFVPIAPQVPPYLALDRFIGIADGDALIRLVAEFN